EDEAFLGRLVTGQRDTLLRSGARVGFYLLSDLLRPDFPKAARLLLFLNAFRLPDDIKIAVRDRHQDDGRTLAWLYGPASLEESLSESSDVIGMTMRLRPWGSKMGTTVLSNVNNPLIEGLRGQHLGEDVRLNPSFFITDTRAEVLGEYADGTASIGYRKHPRWQSVVIA